MDSFQSTLARSPQRRERSRLSQLLAAALIATFGAGASAATETAAPPKAEDEVQRFCANIADAAKDRRYALQTMELEKLQADIDTRIAALEAKRAEYETWLNRREAFLAQAEDKVVKIYATMRPDAAAERLAELRVELAAGILMKLDAKKAGVILNEMERKAAAALTGIMAAAVRTTDPT